LSKTVYAEADVSETFPVEAGIYDLNELLASISLVDSEYTIQWDEKYVKFVSPQSSVTYYYADKEVLFYPKKPIKEFDSDATFNITAGILSKILKAASTLKTTDVVIVGDDSGAVIRVGDKKVRTSNKFSIRISDSPQQRHFETVFKVDNLKMIPSDYTLEISQKGASKWKTPDNALTYYIAMEHDSKFGE
jgi:hypothetical protein